MPDKETYALLKAKGICVTCMQADAIPGESRCQKCKEDRKKNWHRHKKRHMEAVIEREKRLHKSGLCASCGTPAAGWYCDECKYIRNVQAKIRYLRKKKGTWDGKFLSETTKLKIAVRVLPLIL